MDLLADRTWFLLAVGCYGLATVHAIVAWRRGLARGDWLNYGLVALGFVPHTAGLLARGFSLDQCPVTNLFEALMFFTWAIVAGYLVVGLWPRLRSMSVFLAPALVAIGVLALQGRLDEPGPRFDLEHWALSLHVALVLLGYAAFGVASLAAALFLVREQPGSSAGALALAGRLPTSARLERAMLRALGLGLVLLTAGLAASFGLMRERYGVFVRPDPKIAWSILVWGVYLALVVARMRFGQPPRRLAWGALAGFAFVVLTFWSTNLLSPIHHP